MDTDNSKKQYTCVTDGCNKPVPMGLFCSLKCAVKYGAYDHEKGWIIEDKVLDSIKREEYIKEK